MTEPKRPRGRPAGLPKSGGRKPGTAGRRLHITLPRDIGAALPANNDEARTVILEAVREWLKL